MPAVINKVPNGEKHWAEAKAIAAKAGKANQYAYVMGIFKKITGYIAQDGIGIAPYISDEDLLATYENVIVQQDKYDVGVVLNPHSYVDTKGCLHSDCIVTNVGFFPVLLDGLLCWELRRPEEVFNPESVDTIKMIPATDDHHGIITKDEIGKYAVGWTGENVTILKNRSGKDQSISVPIVIHDQALVHRILKDHGAELSCGYKSIQVHGGEGHCNCPTCNPEHKIIPDEMKLHYNGQPYDFEQVKIVYNHVAVVKPNDVARQSLGKPLDEYSEIHATSIHLDTLEKCAGAHVDIRLYKPFTQEDSVPKKMWKHKHEDGTEKDMEVEEDVYDCLDSMHKKHSKEVEEHKKTKAQLDAANDEIKKLKEESDKGKTKTHQDSVEQEDDKRYSTYIAQKIKDGIAARSKIISDARKCGLVTVMESKHEDIADTTLFSNEEIMKRIYKHLNPKTQLSLDDKTTLPVLYASAMEHCDSISANVAENESILDVRTGGSGAPVTDLNFEYIRNLQMTGHTKK